ARLPRPRPAIKGFTGQLPILLTHLHLDHIQGLMFFAPMFEPGAEITVWGPASPGAALLDRIAGHISGGGGARAAVPPRRPDHRRGAGLAGGLTAAPQRALHHRAARAHRGPRAAVPRL